MSRPRRTARAAARRPRAARAGAPRRGFDDSLLRHLLVWVVALKILAIVVLVDASALQAFALPKALISRAAAWALAGALLLSLLRYGPGILPRSRLHLLVGGYVLVALISTAQAENTYTALYGERDRYLGLTFLVDMCVLYLAVAVAYRNLRDWAILAGSVGLAFALAVTYALVQRAGLDPMPWAAGPAVRPGSTFGNPDPFAHFLGVVFALGLGLTLLASHAPFPRLLRGLGAAAAVAALAMAALVASRAVYAGILAALVVLPLVYVRVRGMSRRVAVELGAAGSAVALALILVLALSPLGERVVATVQGAGVQERVFIYRGALAAIADRPVLGFGPDNFTAAYPRYREPESLGPLGFERHAESAHSWPLQAAATTGLVGLAAMIALLAAFAWLLWSRAIPRSPAVGGGLALASAAYWGQGLVSVGAHSIEWVPWVAFGGAVAISSTQVMPADRRSKGFALVVFLVVVVVTVGALSGLQALGANREARFAEAHWNAGNAAPAIQAAEAAVRLDSGRADYWNWLGLSLTLEERWREAGDAFGEAAARSPHDATYWANLARARMLEATNGQPRLMDEALRAAERAESADPFYPDAVGVLAQVRLAAGQHDLALQAAVRAVLLDELEPTYGQTAMIAARDVADAAAARRTLADALERLHLPNPWLHAAMALVALELGDTDAARTHATRALVLDPGNEDAQDVLSALGD